MYADRPRHAAHSWGSCPLWQVAALDAYRKQNPSQHSHRSWSIRVPRSLTRYTAPHFFAARRLPPPTRLLSPRMRTPCMTVSKQEDLIPSVACALKFIFYYHPVDFLKPMHEDSLREEYTADRHPTA